ncbi:hypothetical protein FOCC_FOCC011179, partial [Frankliniella occidentalis]
PGPPSDAPQRAAGGPGQAPARPRPRRGPLRDKRRPPPGPCAVRRARTQSKAALTFTAMMTSFAEMSSLLVLVAAALLASTTVTAEEGASSLSEVQLTASVAPPADDAPRSSYAFGSGSGSPPEWLMEEPCTRAGGICMHRSSMSMVEANLNDPGDLKRSEQGGKTIP